MFKYKMTFSYDGSNYSGYQIQPHSRTIQETIESALFIILRKKTRIISSGRTDAKVHALNQVCHFETENTLDQKFIFSLNSILPKDIRVLKVTKAKKEFHARYSSKSKIYHYHLYLKKVEDPFLIKTTYKPIYKVDIDLLKKASKKFLGKKDFSCFANSQHLGAAKNSPIKNLKRLDVIKTKYGIRLEIEADGFLYKMVRNITGTLLDISYKKRPIEDIDKIFESKDRKKASKTAPANALFLYKVIY